MTYKEVGFRAVYYHFCVIRLNDNLRGITGDLPGIKNANAVLGYGNKGEYHGGQ